MRGSPVVLIESPADGVGLVRINRPESRNALTTEVRSLIAQYLTESSANDAVRCIVIAGNEKAFAAGADIKEIAALGAIEHMQTGTSKRWSAIAACTKPVIAAVNGFALGGGCELAMTCDIIIAGKSARLGLPEVRIGVMPGGGGTQRLARAVGKYRAMRYCLTGDLFSGAEAYEMGLVSELVADEDVEKRAIEIATQIAQLAPLAVQQIKEVLLAGQDVCLETALRLESKAIQVLFASQDKKEGMQAFIEKRKPRWQGK